MIYLGDLINFEEFLKTNKKGALESAATAPVVYVEDLNAFIYDESKVFYRKVPELAGCRYLYALKLLEAINNRYIPIFDRNKKLLFTEEEFLEYRSKMGGIKEYTNEDFQLSDNLMFEGLENFLPFIDDNMKQVSERRKPVIEEIVRLMDSIGLTTTIGNNSGGDVELIEAGSTIRGTNLPVASGNNWDFDYTVRINPDKVWVVKNALENGLIANGHITQTSKYKVRLLGVKIPNMDGLIDLDFSLTPEKEEYLSTEDAISEQLENIRSQDEEKYRLVLANIMFAKAFLKKVGVYKPSRGILNGDRQQGGIGGVGIENWILRNGGSFIDAAREFLSHAEGKEFLEFQKEYAILDFGKNHVEVSKGNFPYDNFIMKNMRHVGYEMMREALKQFVEEYDKNQSKGNRI